MRLPEDIDWSKYDQEFTGFLRGPRAKAYVGLICVLIVLWTLVGYGIYHYLTHP